MLVFFVIVLFLFANASAYQHDKQQLLKTNSQLREALRSLTQTETEVGQQEICADEGQKCSCTGTIYYGRRHDVDKPAYDPNKKRHTLKTMKALNKYSTIVSSGSEIVCKGKNIDATNPDPDRGFWKSCYCERPEQIYYKKMPAGCYFIDESKNVVVIEVPSQTQVDTKVKRNIRLCNPGDNWVSQDLCCPSSLTTYENSETRMCTADDKCRGCDIPGCSTKYNSEGKCKITFGGVDWGTVECKPLVL